jgi:hypothetical protein
MRRGGCAPIPFEELVEVSEATFAIEEAISSGRFIVLRPPHASTVLPTAEES